MTEITLTTPGQAIIKLEFELTEIMHLCTALNGFTLGLQQQNAKDLSDSKRIETNQRQIQRANILSEKLVAIVKEVSEKMKAASGTAEAS